MIPFGILLLTAGLSQISAFNCLKGKVPKEPRMNPENAKTKTKKKTDKESLNDGTKLNLAKKFKSFLCNSL